MPKRKCKYCKEYVREFIKVPAGVFCNMDHAVKFGKEQAFRSKEKQRLNERKKNRAAVRELDRKTLSWQHKQTQKSFNRMRVLQEFKWFADKGQEPECISCGKTKMDWCAGHYKSRGASPEHRYNELNVFLQCNRRCNLALSANIHGDKTTRGYKQGLFERFGVRRAKQILECIDMSITRKWTCEELEAMRAEFNAEIRRLEAEL